MINDGTPRILIARLSAIGDCILTMPLVVAVRETYPRAFIAWAVEGVAGTMIERHPAVNLAIRLPRRFARSPATLWQLRRRLRSLKFDVALDPQSLTKSALVGRLSGAPRRIGFARPVGRELAPWLNSELVTSQQVHVVDRYLELLAPLAVEPAAARFDFPIDPAAEDRMQAALRAIGHDAPLAVLNPGAGWPSKVWPQERYAALAERLFRQQKVRSLVTWAGEQERASAQAIVEAAGCAALLAPPTSLLELAAVLRRAKLFVGSDTGPLHMAAAVGTPCVGIYGPTRPAECGPYGAGHVAIQARYQAGTSRQRRRAPNDAMREVSVEQVLEACQRVLSRPEIIAA